MNNVIRRPFGLTELKFAGQDSSEMVFSGYGAVFNNVDAYGDVIKPGAFAETLSEAQTTGQWPTMLLQHGGWGMSADDLTPIGVWTEMAEDGHGLKVSGKLADTPRGREAYSLMKMTPRPAINGLSIGYIPKDYEPRSKPEEPRRTLKRVDLVEISLVTFPANPKARIGEVKSLENGLDTLPELEDFLRDVGGFSNKEAKTLVAKIRSTVHRDDADEAAVRLAAALSSNINKLRG